MIFSNFSPRDIISTILLMVMISPATVLATPMTKQQVPLKVSLKLHEQVGFRPDCPSQFGGTTTGTGKGTHFGKISFTATDCVTAIEYYFTFEGEFTLAAANGDTLTGNYGGLFIPIDTGPIYRLSDAAIEITGGTGRFAEATGNAELTGTESITTGDGAFAANGTMSNLGRGSFNKALMRVTGEAFHNPVVVNEYKAMFRNFATVDPLEETPRQPALIVGSVSGSNVALVPEPAVLILLGTGLAMLQFAQRKKKC